MGGEQGKIAQAGRMRPYPQQHDVIFEAITGIFGVDDPVSNTDPLLALLSVTDVVGSQNHSDPQSPARKHQKVPAALGTGTAPSAGG